MAEQIYYTLTQGDCLVFNRQITDEDNANAAIDVSSAHIELGLAWPDGSYEVESPAVSGGADGWISAEVPASVTAGLPVGRTVRIQLRITFAGACPQTVLSGRVRVLQKALS